MEEQQKQQQQQKKKKVAADSAAVEVVQEDVNVVLTHAICDFDSLASAVGLAKLWSHQVGRVLCCLCLVLSFYCLGTKSPLNNR